MLGFGIELDKDALFAVAAQAFFEEQFGEADVAMIGVFEHHFHIDFVAFQLHATDNDGGQLLKLGGGNAGVIEIKVFREAAVAVDDAQAGTTQKEETFAQRTIIDELQQLVLEVLAQDKATEGLQRGWVLGLNLGEAKHGLEAGKAALRRAGSGVGGQRGFGRRRGGPGLACRAARRY